MTDRGAIQMLKSYSGMSHKLTDNQGRPKLDQAIEKVLNLIEKRDKQLQAIYEEFNKYNWENSTETQLRNQIKSLYNAIKGEFINDR